MKVFFAIFLGGGLGSISRYWLGKWLSESHSTLFPLGTFVINITGCFLIGIFLTLAEKYALFNTDWKLFLTTGFCGGFTTFSTFAYEKYRLLANQELLLFFLYLGGSISLGLLAVWLGVLVVKSL